MIKQLFIVWLLLCFSSALFAQAKPTYPLSQKEMRKDLALFRKIRTAANSGVYKYRSVAQIDSIYQWADKEIEQSNSLFDFYKILVHITDFEGSCHNATRFPDKINTHIKAEKTGYFPYPVKEIEGKLIVNFKNDVLALGSEILSVNGIAAATIKKDLYKFVPTDGFSYSPKKIAILWGFSPYFRYQYGLQSSFDIEYTLPLQGKVLQANIPSVARAVFYKNRTQRHSSPIDNSDDKADYKFEQLEKHIAKLTINTFSIGSDANDPEHKAYDAFLDSMLLVLKTQNIDHLIVDIRNNGGGTAPNDMQTLSCFTQKPVKEIRSAWISMDKVPYWKYFTINYPFYLRPIVRYKINQRIRKEVPVQKNGNRHYKDIKVYSPKKNAYQGKLYLLVGPHVASAASLFAASMDGHTNAVLIGEETIGGYYGHNGAFPMAYTLSKSKIKTIFSVVNIEQEVPKVEDQAFGSGVIPDYKVEQNLKDFLGNIDSQLNYTLDLIKAAH